MSICAKLVKEGGQMIFITPRSFASGRHFQSFRTFSSHVHIDRFIYSIPGSDTFAKDEVLQELVIMRMHPAGEERPITVSFSRGISDLDHPYQKDYPASHIVDVQSEDKVVYLPVDGRMRLSYSFPELGRQYGEIQYQDINGAGGSLPGIRFHLSRNWWMILCLCTGCTMS